MKKTKLSDKRSAQIASIQSDYIKTVEALKIECQNKIQKVLDDYNIQKVRSDLAN